MTQRPNAKLTPKGRETLVSRMESGLGAAEAARQMGVSRQTAGKWLHRRGPVTRVSYERESPGEFVHVDVKKVPAYPTAAGAGPWGADVGPRGARASPACTSPSTTSAGSPTPSCCPTSAMNLPQIG